MNSIDLNRIPQRYWTVLGVKRRNFEPVATAWIVDLCRSEPRFKAAFLGALSHACAISGLENADSLSVVGQYRSSRARFDIVVQNARGRSLVVVEAKVDEAVDAFQLQSYRELEELRQANAIFVSLARPGALAKLANRQEWAALGVRFVSWPELLSAIKAEAPASANAEVISFFRYCHDVCLDGVARSLAVQVAPQRGRWRSFRTRSETR